METIRSATGHKNPWKINKYFQGEVHSVQQKEELFIAEKFGQTFIISTNVVTLNSTALHLLLFLKNTSATKYLYNATLEPGYNGGSTNHNRCMNLLILGGFTGPTANHDEAVINNVHFQKGGETAEAEAYIWDGNGDGMTYSGGGLINGAVIPKDHRVYDTYGMPIMGLNDYMGIAVQAEEAGTVSIAIRFFFKDKPEV